MSAGGVTRARILIAGGGLAGVEAALALQSFAADRTDVVVLDPRSRFAVPATAAGHAFGVGWSIDRPLASVIERAGARLRRARLVDVDSRRRIAMLAGGELAPYDRLIVAIGGRPQVCLADALTFRGHADAEELRAMVDGITESAARGGRPELAIVIPAGCGWPLTGYEIALMAHEHLAAAGHRGACAITVLTAEETPLEDFGEEVGATVARTLSRAGVTVRVAAPVRDFQWGRLELEGGHVVSADRVVALPRLAGPQIDGLPSDEFGFVACEPGGRVPGAPGVHVVGDAGSATVRQGGLACRQADDAAMAIARELGVAGLEPPDAVTAEATVVGPPGAAWPPAATPGTESSLPWPVPRVAGRFLTPLLTELSRPLPAL